jgi:hypothetical protein
MMLIEPYDSPSKTVRHSRPRLKHSRAGSSGNPGSYCERRWVPRLRGDDGKMEFSWNETYAAVQERIRYYRDAGLRS